MITSQTDAADVESNFLEMTSLVPYKTQPANDVLSIHLHVIFYFIVLVQVKCSSKSSVQGWKPWSVFVLEFALLPSSA